MIVTRPHLLTKHFCQQLAPQDRAPGPQRLGLMRLAVVAGLGRIRTTTS